MDARRRQTPFSVDSRPPSQLRRAGGMPADSVRRGLVDEEESS
jgi:hypothetical protein